MKWHQEILNYFRTGITNARTEGFNNIAKLAVVSLPRETVDLITK